MVASKNREICEADRRPEAASEIHSVRGMLRKAVTITILTLAPISFARAQDRPVSVGASTAFASDYVPAIGRVTGEGPVNQTEVDLNIGGNLTASLWNDYSLKTGTSDERDFDLILHGNLFTIRNSIFKGGVWGSASVQDWVFPSGIFNTDLRFAVATVGYSGLLEASLQLNHLLNGPTPGRDLIVADPSKSFGLCTVGDSSRLCISPTLKASYGDGILGADGLCQATPGLSLRLEGQQLDIELFIKSQMGLAVRQNITYGGISASLSL